MLKKTKDKLFFTLVEKNSMILHEYQDYKWSIEGRENKLKSWSYIALLNIKHRLLNIANTNNRPNKTSKKQSSKLGRLPYLEGSESTVIERGTPLQFVKSLLQYDIVSFDIFDTLILRPFSRPQDLFMILGEKFGITDFVAIRQDAEKEAREKSISRKGNREVTIYDIYKIIEFKTGLDMEYGVKVEFETELEFCFANPYMKEVFNIVKSHSKRIIAISDMYLTRDMIEELLLRNGYEGFLNIFVSGEYNGSKRDKALYKQVMSQYKNETIIHVGDNYKTDIRNAKEMGLKAKYYENVHDIGNKYRAAGMSDLIGSAYAGVVNTVLHNGIKKYSPYFEYGFIYGGLYVLGYCNWINKYSERENIDKILFLSRDGEIYKRVYDYLFPNSNTEYVFWSRIANIKYTIENNRNEFLTRMIHHKAIGARSTTIRVLLESLDLINLIEQLPRYKLKAEEVVHNGNARSLEKLFVDNWDIIIRNYAEETELAEKYFREIVGDSKKVAVIDVGWAGSSGAGIKYLIEKKWKMDCKVYSLVAGNRHGNHNADNPSFLKEEIVPYIFSRNYNRKIYDYHSKLNNGTNNIYFELFTQATYPSFAGFKAADNGYSLTFDVPEVENYEMITEIHEGIMSFVKVYSKVFKNYPYMFNISGHDAYSPFKMIVKDLSFIKKYFGDFLFSREIFADHENQSLTALSDILKNKKLL